MQRFLAEGEALQQVGVMGLRAPDLLNNGKCAIILHHIRAEVKPESGRQPGKRQLVRI